MQSWCPWSVTDKQVLEKAQCRAVKMVSNLMGRTYEERLAELGMVTLETRWLRGDMLQTFRIMAGIDLVEPGTWFQLSNQVVREGAAGTRSVDSVHGIQEVWPKVEIRKNFFSSRVVKPWNNLPAHIKSSRTVNEFKNSYDEWFAT